MFLSAAFLFSSFFLITFSFWIKVNYGNIFLGAMIFKVVPFFIGLFLMFYVIHLNGWVYNI